MLAWPNASVSTASKYCPPLHVQLVELADHLRPQAMCVDLFGGQTSE